ncbi:non-ribosomal peptide synthetase [Deefgea rivuli]|uniref:non-ribosomal peptide synthetase n=1 Tax=Deefgea rivuli TaxID=400948 RepID=UPI000688EAC6|nr:non-ribosomal peptide synthetase [Deefgea rivuli]
MSDTIAARRAQLSPEQKALLAQRLRGKSDAQAAQSAQAIPRRSGSKILSHAQQRQWFLWQLEPNSSAYHLCGCLRFTGQIKLAALQASLQQVVERHASLRTIFRATDDGLAEQEVQDVVTLNVDCIDLRQSSDPQLSCQRQSREFNSQPFDLTCGPLLRCRLFQLTDDDFQLVVVMHHIVSDGSSMQILVQELAAFYRAAVAGTSATLPELPIQYADYAAWQREWLAAGEMQRQLAYWREQLGDTHPVLMLASDYPRRPDMAQLAAQHHFSLPAQLLTQLKTLAQQRGATLFMLLLAAFQTLLYRYTGQNDIRIGVPIANRNRLETHGVVGFFVNTQVLRGEINGDLSLSEVLDRARDTALGAQTWQDLPFDQLVEALKPERTQGSNPLFQVMYNHLRQDLSALASLPDAQLIDFQVIEEIAQFELDLQTTEHADGRVSARLAYIAALFKPETVARMAQHYVMILEQLVATPQQSLASLNFLAADEVAQLNAWGTNPQRFDTSQPVHRLIEAQVAQRSDAIALIFGEVELSYAELNQRANQLAHYLIEQGIGLESKVGIALERSVEMVIALLAVLKAGGAYVPLDPEYPQDRLMYMVEDSGINSLLTHTSLINRIPSSNSQVTALDTLDLSKQSIQNPDIVIHGDNLAYVIYTSGSTGKPKGVAVRHEALSHFLHSMRAAPGMNADDKLLALTSLAFDIAGLELYLPLICGAQILLAEQGTASVLALAARASVIQATPSGWRVLLALGWLPKQGIKGLCGGEALQADLAQILRSCGVELWNMYGPTETTIWSSVHCLRDVEITLGRAIAATQLWVLDANLQHCPIGAAGELYIGGVGLARGYLNRAELSAERFVADPFDVNGERLYRTGDLVRRRADGQLEYLGRLDHQVKIRGFRIELGEIEAQLLAQASVREAVVIAQEGPGGVRLVGYVSPHAGITLDTTQLKFAIAAVLPDYMVPSVLVVLESLPLNPNGKVDRKALPKPELVSQSYEAPQGEIETALAQIWAEILGLEQVGRDDNFFEVGGHSLKAMEAAALLKKKHGWQIAIRSFFEWPNLKDFARHTLNGQAAQLDKLSTINDLLAEFEV